MLMIKLSQKYHHQHHRRTQRLGQHAPCQVGLVCDRGLGFHVSTNIITPTCPNSPAAINVAAQGKPALLVNAEPINGPII